MSLNLQHLLLKSLTCHARRPLCNSCFDLMSLLKTPPMVQTKDLPKSRADDSSVLAELKGWQTCGPSACEKLTKALQLGARKSNEIPGLQLFIAETGWISHKYQVVKTLFLNGRFGVVLRRVLSANLHVTCQWSS